MKTTRALVLFLAVGCAKPPAPAPSAAAEKPKVEAELGRTTISKQAAISLGIETVPVRVEMVQERRTLTGWIMVRPGSEVTLTAPVGGYVRAPTAPATPPAPGQAVRQGQELFRLEPVLSPLEATQLASLRRGIEGDLAKARESASVAENELKRIETLYKQNLRGQRDVEQARMQVKVAQEDLTSAEDKLKVLAAPGAGKEGAGPAILSLTAPRSGVALTVPVSPGQFVAAAAPLTSIVDLSRPWVRVPVPEYDLARIDRDKDALIRIAPEGRGDALSLKGKPVALVPQVDLQRHTADVMYELELPSTAVTLAKDQMVFAAIPVGKRSECAIVPYGAVIFDAYGGSWIYLDKTPKADTHVYERTRVELGVPLGDDVAVRPALKAGDHVVRVGAAALFSREFHRPPVPVPEIKKKKGTTDEHR